MMESDQTTIFILMCVGVTAVGSIGRALPSLAGFRSLLAFHDAAYFICMQPPHSGGWSCSTVREKYYEAGAVIL